MQWPSTSYSQLTLWILAIPRDVASYVASYVAIVSQKFMVSSIASTIIATYGTAQRQLDTRTWLVGSAPKGNISTTRYGHAGARWDLPVLSKAGL